MNDEFAITSNDDEKLEEFNAAEAQAQAKLNEVVRAVCSTEEGQTFVRALLDNCDLYSRSMGSEPNSTYMLLGRRDVGLSIKKILDDADPKIYGRIMENEDG